MYSPGFFNLTKHGVDFSEAANFDWSEALVETDDRQNYGEPRFYAIAPIGKRLYVMVFTHRSIDIRIISPRKANKREVIQYVKKT